MEGAVAARYRLIAGSGSDGTTSRGYDVSNGGAVVGQSDKAGGLSVAIMRHFPAAMKDAGIANAVGSGISDLGRMVGRAPAGAFQRAATKKGTPAFSFLPTLAMTMLSDAREVDRCGHAVGSTTFFTGQVHATRWTNSPCDYVPYSCNDGRLPRGSAVVLSCVWVRSR